MSVEKKDLVAGAFDGEEYGKRGGRIFCKGIS